MKGWTSSASSVMRMFSKLLCTAVNVQLREPVMRSRPSTTANLWCMYAESTSHRTQMPMKTREKLLCYAESAFHPNPACRKLDEQGTNYHHVSLYGNGKLFNSHKTNTYRSFSKY
ncbi:hypothetical protein ILYODFUR_032420 [Ilyodon furcidens]|uniref:Secreted protein n=1 Tax=Ilyodon furcidens TaxID=33524 RepID=A0ABV0V800_9TELE